jgi:hypothetical protein
MNQRKNPATVCGATADADDVARAVSGLEVWYEVSHPELSQALCGGDGAKCDANLIELASQEKVRNANCSENREKDCVNDYTWYASHVSDSFFFAGGWLTIREGYAAAALADVPGIVGATLARVEVAATLIVGVAVEHFLLCVRTPHAPA